MSERAGLGREALAGACAAVITGVLMAVITVTVGALAGSLLAIVALTVPLVVAGVVYGWMIDNDRMRIGFGPGIIFWIVAFPLARFVQELMVGSADSGLSQGMGSFFAYQALVGGAFGLGFVLLQNVISTWMGREEAGG